MKISFFPHQMSVIRAYQNGYRRFALMGGVGWGKTFLSHTLALPLHGLKVKTRMIMCMETADLVNKTIRADLEDKWGDVIKAKKEGLITLVNGTEIFLLAGYDQVKGVSHLDNYSISLFAMSQAENMPEETYSKLVARARKKAVNGEILEIIEGNPKGRDWIDKHFCQGIIPTKRKATVQGVTYEWDEYRGEKTFAIYVPTQNFPWLPEGYLQRQMEGKSQRWIDRYILGKRDAVTGLVYDCWNEAIHVVNPFTILPKIDKHRFKRIVGIDWGRRNPAACLWAIYDRHEDTFYLYREYYKSGHTPSEFANIIRDLNGDEEIDMVLIDPSTKNDTGLGNVQEIIASTTGWVITDAENDVKRGIDVVHEYLASKKLFVFRGLDNFIEEITHYEYGDNVDKPSKTDPIEAPRKLRDHLMDVIKYIVYNRHQYINDGFMVKNKEKEW